MADKDKPEETEEAKKKGLPSIVLVAIGAILGGAGVVFAVPPKKVEVKVEAVEPKVGTFEHKDELDFVFNPKTKAGKSIASVSFYFAFETREDRLDGAYELIGDNWDRAISACLMTLKSRTLRELNSDKGQEILERDLIDTLNHALFGSEEQPIADVTEILWKKYMIQ